MRTRDDNKKQAIDAAVVKLVNEIGYTGISMSKVAGEAGVSPATLYVYYDGKDNMLRKVYVDAKRHMLRATAKGVDSATSTEGAVRCFLANTLEWLEQNWEEALFIEQSMDSPLIGANETDAAFSESTAVIEAFEQGVSDGMLKEASAMVLVGFCMYPVTQLYKEAQRAGTPVGIVDFEQVFDMCWDAVRRR